MRHWAALLSCALLTACASAPQPIEQPEQLFHDELFQAPSQRIAAADVFALSDEMRRYLREEIAPQLRSEGRLRGLVQALYSRSQLKLEYDAAMTRNAAQAFAARTGNCLSLVIMTAALAKELELPVEYQHVLVEETWSRSADLYYSSAHVNLTLGRRLVDLAERYSSERAITIDFLPSEDVRGRHTRVLSEATILAMYMNNRAFEAMVQGRLDDAYWWAREAIRQSPAFLSAFNTLGVVYLRHGNLREAERTIGALLAREPANVLALSNQALVFERQQRHDEALALRQRLARIEPYPPYHFYNLGIAAMKSGDFAAAREQFAREIERAAYNDEFHFWLAVAEVRLGRLHDARRHLETAIENSSTREHRDLYAAKLNWLNARRLQ